MTTRRAFEHLDKLLDHLSSPVYVKDKNHAWVYLNPAFCNLLGHPSEFLIGKTDYDITPKDQSDIFWEKDNEVLSTKITNINVEKTTNADGNIVWVESRKSYFENENGESFVFGVLTDITRLMERELELQRSIERAKLADVAKSQFLANMSHEIRTPMNGVMGMTQLLSTCDLPEKEKKYVKVIMQSGEDLLDIINDILDFSNIETGKMTLEALPFVLRDCIESVMTTLVPRLPQKGLDFLLRINPKLPLSYVGDVNRIRQVLTKIVGNAIKFTSNGHVYINVDGTVEDDIVHLTFNIEDTGIGIPPDKLSIVFDKFSQADNSTTRKYGGTGLGLNIARDLVQMMGTDTIDVKSELNKGTTFSFTLDLPQHDDCEKSQDVSTSLRGSKILIVDDNAYQRAILTEQFNHWGSKCIAVGSADTAMRVLQAGLDNDFVFDAIVTDYEMPDKNGEAFIVMVKAVPRLKDIPVIMLSSVDTKVLQIRMLNLGVDNFLIKPIRNDMLLSRMSEIMCLSELYQVGPTKKVA